MDQGRFKPRSQLWFLLNFEACQIPQRITRRWSLWRAGEIAGLVYRFFLSGRWVSAEPATLFTRFGVFLFLKSLEAVLPTLFDVFSFFDILSPPLSIFEEPRKSPIPYHDSYLIEWQTIVGNSRFFAIFFSWGSGSESGWWLPLGLRWKGGLIQKWFWCDSRHVSAVLTEQVIHLRIHRLPCCRSSPHQEAIQALANVSINSDRVHVPAKIVVCVDDGFCWVRSTCCQHKWLPNGDQPCYRDTQHEIQDIWLYLWLALHNRSLFQLPSCIFQVNHGPAF